VEGFSGEWGENDEANLFKDLKMLQRFEDISILPEKKKNVYLQRLSILLSPLK
jgi:hypothetical protein